MFDKKSTKNFFDQLRTYMTKTDSLLESHYNTMCPLREDQKILVLELYANAVVIYRFMKGLLSRFGKDESITWDELSAMSIKQEEAIRLSEMVKIIMQILAELEFSGVKLENN
tara:strand:+ start:527 stop:865 length:339 start_codon:yes stop_codon:yes gene_type:complete